MRAHTRMYTFKATVFGHNSNIPSTFQEQGPADTAYLGGCILKNPHGIL